MPIPTGAGSAVPSTTSIDHLRAIGAIKTALPLYALLCERCDPVTGTGAVDLRALSRETGIPYRTLCRHRALLQTTGFVSFRNVRSPRAHLQYQVYPTLPRLGADGRVR